MDIIRAWKDEEYRLSLSEEEQALLPANPAGLTELSDDELDSIVGGTIVCQASAARNCNNSGNCVSAVCSAVCANSAVCIISVIICPNG